MALYPTFNCDDFVFFSHVNFLLQFDIEFIFMLLSDIQILTEIFAHNFNQFQFSIELLRVLVHRSELHDVYRHTAQLSKKEKCFVRESSQYVHTLIRRGFLSFLSIRSIYVDIFWALIVYNSKSLRTEFHLEK